MANQKVLKEVEKKLTRRYNTIQMAYADDTISTGIFGLIEYIENTSVLKQLAEALLSLKDGTTVAEWREIAKDSWVQPPVERDAKARLCYEFLSEWYGKKDDKDFNFTMAFIDVAHRMSPSTKNYDELARVFVASFIDPFVEYLDEELEALIADEEVKDEDVSEPQPENRHAVFVVHGRDKETLRRVVKYLKENGLQPLTFNDAKSLVDTSVPSILQVVDKGMSEAQAVLVLLTPDDEARLKEGGEELEGQARPNVIFEAGIAFGRYRKRTVLVEYEEPSMFSDLHGFYVVRLNERDGAIEGFEDLRKQLRVAGCELD